MALPPTIDSRLAMEESKARLPCPTGMTGSKINFNLSHGGECHEGSGIDFSRAHSGVTGHSYVPTLSGRQPFTTDFQLL